MLFGHRYCRVYFIKVLKKKITVNMFNRFLILFIIPFTEEFNDIDSIRVDGVVGA